MRNRLKENLKTAREKWFITYKKTKLRLIIEFSLDSEGQRQKDNIFKVMKEKIFLTKNKAKLFFKDKDKIKPVQINKGWENLLFTELSYKKLLKSFRLKGNDA